MDTMIVYEATRNIGISWQFALLCLADLATIICFVKRFKKFSISGKLFFGFIAVFLSFLVGCLIFGAVDSFDKVYAEYQKGNALVVEGEIHDYDPNTEGNELPDNFRVGDVDFSVPGFTTSWGYPVRQRDGGMLKDGMQVRIWYIPYKFENVILKIELIE